MNDKTECGAVVLCAAVAGQFQRMQDPLLGALGAAASCAPALRTDGLAKQEDAQASLKKSNIELDRRVRERTFELALVKERAERADLLKSAFLATLSHEFRTPLHSIAGLSSLLTEGSTGPLNPTQSAYLKIIRDNVQHMLALMNDVLDIAQIEAGQLQIVREKFDLDESIERVMAMVQPLADKKRLALRCDIRQTAGTIVSDRRRIEQILLNLLSNAIKYTERGEVLLRCEISIRHGLTTARPAPHVVRLSVADTGIGIDAADIPKLFQPFRQFDSTGTNSFGGSGLGLAICKSLSDLLGGDMTVRSLRGHGSTFIFSLPLVRIPTTQ